MVENKLFYSILFYYVRLMPTGVGYTYTSQYSVFDQSLLPLAQSLLPLAQSQLRLAQSLLPLAQSDCSPGALLPLLLMIKSISSL